MDLNLSLAFSMADFDVSAMKSEVYLLEYSDVLIPNMSVKCFPYNVSFRENATDFIKIENNCTSKKVNDIVDKKEKMRIIPCSGFVRIRR